MDESTLQAFRQLDAVLSPATNAKLADAAPDLCGIYRSIKGPAEALLPILEMIPVYGKTIANLIRTLLQIAAVACPG